MAAQGGPCEICGVMGWGQFILTCETCGSRKHQYCTKILLMEAPDNWTCEACRLNIKGTPSTPYQQKDSPGAKEVEDNKRGKDSTRSLNTVKTKKVKYLPLEYVLKMPLGEREGSRFQTRRKDNPLVRQANKAMSPLQAKDPVRESKQHVTAEKPVKSNPALIGEVSALRKGESKKLMPSSSSIPHAIEGFPGDNLSKVARDKGVPEKKDAISRADIYRPHFPSERVTWTGRFKFPDDTSADGCGDLVFDAVSPGRVSRNAFEHSLNLPPDLHVQLIPLSQLLPDLFPHSVPDLRDIGIYFATEDASDRSFRTYKSLVECLLSKKFALRCSLDGAELFIFTSNILNSDSQFLVTSGLKTEYFLWGVYCSTRSRGDRSSSQKGLFSKSSRQKDENENRLWQDISPTEPIVEGRGVSYQTAKSTAQDSEKVELSEKEMVATSAFPSAEMETESCHISKRPSKKPRTECVTNSKIGEMKKMVPISEPSSVEKAVESCGLVPSEGFIKNVNVEGQVLPSVILEPRPKPPSDMLISEQSNNLKNWVTLNTSSAWRSEKGTAGAGGIISTSSGKWMSGFVMNLGECDKQRADLWSLLQGLKLLWEQGYRAVNLKSDSASALSLLQTAPAPEDPNRELILACRDILVRDWKCIRGHVKVEENVAAHRLADQFESYKIGPTILQTPPPKLSCFFRGKDC